MTPSYLASSSAPLICFNLLFGQPVVQNPNLKAMRVVNSATVSMATINFPIFDPTLVSDQGISVTL